MVLGFAQTEGKLNLPEVVALQIDESELALVTDFVSNVESALRVRSKLVWISVLAAVSMVAVTMVAKTVRRSVVQSSRRVRSVQPQRCRVSFELVQSVS